eukprot:CAMPEP_0173076956 /NCGR_PEP_ID=MMETSP1102-20130122/12830_1 /TAXON_ID=49646 /ORGANISM="Geminigera sp., Strain Caron Lab Isolate" /LENGTH=174 /DNA_ID=CAMNT_0013947133 /DNA_START=277 /DNA_END=801 /DNA_ORIENTATION=+
MKGWKKCVLQILTCKPVEIHTDHLIPLHAEPSQSPNLFEIQVRLLTGRRHQIRAQVASLGSPIWRDSLYAPLSGITLDLENMEAAAAESCTDLVDGIMESPSYPPYIALQAMRIKLLDIDVTARTPWWYSAYHIQLPHTRGGGGGGGSSDSRHVEVKACEDITEATLQLQLTTL